MSVLTLEVLERVMGNLIMGKENLADAAAALDWLERENFDNSQCWVVRFFIWIFNCNATT